MTCNKKLVRSERLQIYKMKRLGYGIREISRELERSHTTILREFKRNAEALDPLEDYINQANQAHAFAHKRRSAASQMKMRLKCPEIRWYVEFHLRHARWSPEIIGGKLTQLGYSISGEAIYQFINIERPELKESLLIAGKYRRRRIAGKRHRKLKQPATPKRSIEVLPEAAKNRTEIGHFELDAIVGKHGKSALQNKVDRRSRKMFLDKVPNLQSETYADIQIKRMQSLPKGVLKTWLQDNGTEHAAHSRVDRTLGTLTHFCHPHCAPERGTVENRNRGPRRFLPKGTDFDDIPADFIEWIEDYFNNMPMKVLGFRTPNQVWHAEIKNAA
jgi:transposase, IS30 family